MKACHNCKNIVEDAGSISRADTCPSCSSDLHCCLNCRFHETGAYNECLENQAERVLEKSKSNFCEYFFFRDVQGSARVWKKLPNPLDNLFDK